MISKRYVLLEAEGNVTLEERKEFARHLEERFGKLKLIPVEGNERALVVKTDNSTAPLIREESTKMSIGDKRIVSVLTSGSIGKLKRRALGSGARDVGKVPQR